MLGMRDVLFGAVFSSSSSCRIVFLENRYLNLTPKLTSHRPGTTYLQHETPYPVYMRSSLSALHSLSELGILRRSPLAGGQNDKALKSHYGILRGGFGVLPENLPLVSAAPRAMTMV